MKKEKEIEFNPADYDYLDKASLEEYVSEFLSRNKSFQSDYKKNIDKDPEDILLFDYECFKKYKVHIKYFDYTDFIKDIRANKTKVLINPTVTAFRLLPGRTIANEKIAKELDLKQKKIEKAQGIIKSMWYCYDYSLFIDKDGGNVVDILDNLFHVIDDNGEYRFSDTLLLAINLNRNKDEILSDLNSLLKIHKKRKTGNQRIKKWKYYLIVYDLHDKGLDYPEIADKLSWIYPDKKNLVDEKNIENYYKNALKLINGDYKKYL